MELITNLQQIGLSRREAEVYIALLQKKEFTAPELTKITTITRTKVYEILQNLIHKGACNENYKNGQKVYRGIEPLIAIQNIIKQYEEEVEKKTQAIIEQKKQAALTLEKELASLHADKQHNLDPIDYIEVLTVVGQIRKRWLDIQRNTKKEMLLFSKEPYTAPLEDNIEEESKSLKNKITYRSIYEYKGITSSEEGNNLIEIIEAYQKLGEKAKIVDELPMKLAISDETVTMLALNDRVSLKPSITTIIIDHPSYARAQKEVFKTYWAKAIPVKDFKRNLNKYI